MRPIRMRVDPTHQNSMGAIPFPDYQKNRDAESVLWNLRDSKSVSSVLGEGCKFSTCHLPRTLLTERFSYLVFSL